VNRLTAASCAIAVAFVLTGGRLLAHEVVVDQVIDMTVDARGPLLLVQLHVPATALADANLPRLPDRTIDPSRITPLLAGIAADVARNLDLQQGESAVPAPTATARLGNDRRSVDIELAYATGGAASVSARLNAFHALEGPPRTDLRYLTTSGAERSLTVTGPPVRVQLDPAAADVARQFAGRGLRTVLDSGDELLFLLCLLLPLRAFRQAITLFAAFGAGQLLTTMIVGSQSTLAPMTIAAAGMAAASAVAVAGLQNVVRARSARVTALAAVFGVLSGVSLGSTVASTAPFGGAHAWLAATSFVVMVLVCELWLGAVGWGTRLWLDQRGAPARILAIIGSVLISHEAVHRVVDRGHLLAQAGAFGGDRAVLWLTLGWAGVMLVLALVDRLAAGADTTGAALAPGATNTR
jgi:HupE / UreJ protein